MTRTASTFARTRRFSRTALVAGLLALSIAAPAAAQSPAPAPELTFAPLVTLPPIMPPAVQTPTALADGYSLGSPDAPVSMEVWEDFQCPFCRRWTEQIKPAVVAELVETGKVRLTYRPLAFLGEESRWAAVAADLAAEQNRFWPLQDLFYANQLGENVGSFSLDRILLMAEAAGLDMQAFTDGLVLDAARERFARLEQTSRVDAGMLGINATPSIVVNGVLLESPDLPTIMAAVEAAMPAPAASEAPAVASPEPSTAG
jgi:protein-disulfide isomerase